MACRVLFFSFTFLSSYVHAVPYSNPPHASKYANIDVWGEQSDPAQPTNLLSKREKKQFPLRILPIGASITYGMGSTDGNGYRKHLRDQLRFEGWEVDMVGTRQSGTMLDNEVDGWPGARLDEVAKKAEIAVTFQPNLITINVGTNDAVQNKTEFTVESIGQRMDKMLDLMFEKVPGTTILLSTVLQNKNDATDRRALVINPQYREIVQRRRKAGQRIVLAEMYESDQPYLGKNDLGDGTHPTDAGFKKMTAIWLAAFKEAEEKSMLQPPNKSKARVPCKSPIPGNGDSGSTSVTTPKDFFQPVRDVQAVQLIKGDAHEAVWRYDNHGIYAYKMKDGQYTEGVALDIKTDCMAKDVRWLDVDNNGVEDFVCLVSDKTTYVTNVQLNQGGSDWPPKFVDVGACAIPRTGDGGAIVDPKLPTVPPTKGKAY